MNTPDALPHAAAVPMARLTCTVHHRLQQEVVDAIHRLPFSELVIEAGRAAVLRMRSSRFPLFAGARFEGYAVDVLRFLVAPEAAESALLAVAAAGGLHEPGRGTVYAERVLVYGLGAQARGAESTPTGEADPAKAAADGQPRPRVRHGLAAITCILSARGAADVLGRLALELGVCVPIITIGSGTGMRDALGLLRITIPREKEFVHLIAPEHDAEGILGLLVEAGRLNQPGKGFVYIRPVDIGVLNTRLRVGRQRAAASVEQIIAAVDDLSGGTTWRRRYPELELFQPPDRRALGRGLCELVLTCDEGCREALVRAAVDAGATGATSARVGRVAAGDAGAATACERTVIVVPASRRDAVLGGLLAAGACTAPATGTVEIGNVPAAYSYMPATAAAQGAR